ncbi:hypothetical protein GCM10010219_67850 [Streptomyces netropsis]|nr:hypothetical protein GCM10010219_67850 [Streptomyces netropsis]
MRTTPAHRPHRCAPPTEWMRTGWTVVRIVVRTGWTRAHHRTAPVHRTTASVRTHLVRWCGYRCAPGPESTA